MGVTVYRSPSVQVEIAGQRQRLDSHCPDPETGLCGACRQSAPCPDANEAAGFLADRGVLVPSSPPGSRSLLTHVWQLRFDLPGQQRGR